MSLWQRLRRRYWLSLSFDVVVIVLVLVLVHGWNTRDLPVSGQVPDLSLAQLDAGGDKHGIPAGEAGVVYFLAPWCFYCRHSIDNLEALVKSGKIGWARAVALDYGNHDEIRSFLATTGFSQPVLLGSRETARDWNIRAFPTYFVLDAEGNISSRSVGYSTRLGLWARARLAQ